jgi:hypothetical protein
MRMILFAAFILTTSTDQALTASSLTKVVDFAAVSIVKDQRMRAVVSNVGAAPCRVHVGFFDADGTLIGEAMTVQLKAGESTSVLASEPPKLVRATVSVSEGVDSAKMCSLKTRVEIFDAQTDVTYVSIPGEAINSNSERTGSIGPAPSMNLYGRTKRANTHRRPPN